MVSARWDSPGPVLGIVQNAHGLGEHIGRYAGLIEYLVQAGFLVYGDDHRGHGHTALSPKDLGVLGGEGLTFS
jgi:alpha-beta hydrolase superfamily lysophospholipase